jgi:hypothetical protein
MDKDSGFFQKYRVERVDGKPIEGWTFTLEEHDPHAVPALKAYSASARADGYVALADDLDALLAARES